MRRTPLRLALPHLLARRQLIQPLIRPAQRPRLQNLLQLHLHLLLQLPLLVPALRLPLPRRDLACRCALHQHQEARLREHGLLQQRLPRRVLLAHLQHCNAIPRVPEHQVLRQDNHVQARRKACARLLERRNNIVRAARRRAVLVVRQGSVRVDRLRDSRNAPAAAVGRVAATTKGR